MGFSVETEDGQLTNEPKKMSNDEFIRFFGIQLIERYLKDDKESYTEHEIYFFKATVKEYLDYTEYTRRENNGKI